MKEFKIYNEYKNFFCWYSVIIGGWSILLKEKLWMNEWLINWKKNGEVVEKGLVVNIYFI